MQREEFIYNPPDGMPQIISETDEYLIVSKQAGLLSVPGRDPKHKDSVIGRVQSRYSEARIVHRLDMDTSGLMVIALSAEVHRDFNLQFEKRLVKKKYVAVLSGLMGTAGEKGLVDAPLICDWPNRPKQIVDPENGKPAVTHYEIIDHVDGCTHVDLYPETGRTHQLRVHMQHLGYPIVGDRFYNSEVCTPRMCLHAQSLSFFPAGLRKSEHDENIRLVFEDTCPF